MLYRGKKYPGRETERFQRVFFRPSFNTLLTRLAHRLGSVVWLNATFRPLLPRESQFSTLGSNPPAHLRGGPQGNLTAGAGREESGSKRKTISVRGECGGVANTDSR